MMQWQIIMRMEREISVTSLPMEIILPCQHCNGKGGYGAKYDPNDPTRLPIMCGYCKGTRTERLTCAPAKNRLNLIQSRN